MAENFRDLEASSLFCPRCKRATPVRKKLLLVLPSGNKYDYTCSACGTQVGGKTDSDASDFYRTVDASRAVPRPGRGGPPRPGPRR
jgi:hypothetical protein